MYSESHEVRDVCPKPGINESRNSKKFLFARVELILTIKLDELLLVLN